jgi:hypothetical protein
LVLVALAVAAVTLSGTTPAEDQASA